MDNKNLLDSSYGLEKVFNGLSVPKTVIKNKTKVKEMVSKRIETIAQENEQDKTLNAKELAISSKKVVEKKKEAIRMDKKENVVKKRIVKKKAVQRKQRKGKSLLTAFRINRMTQRFSLDMNRGELRGKYV